MDEGAHTRPQVRTLQYVVDVSDYFALTRHATWRGIERLYAFVAPLGFGFAGQIAGLALWLAFPGSEAAREESFGWFVSIGAMMGIGAGLFASGAYVASFFEGLHYGSGQPFEMTVSEVGLEETSTAGQRSFVPWSGIAAVREGPDHIFLFLSRLYAFIVPKRAFASPAEASEAARWMIARWQREAVAEHAGGQEAGR